ncbi:MAG: inositol monophosphatase [Alphaproteobacteria bacterium]|nr:inositol monophosphatase [Alphaproteobacteria bacterium]
MPIIAHQKITPRKQTVVFKKNETREEKRISSLSPTLNFMVKAVRHAGASLVRDFREVSQLQVSRKGPGDFVSNADLFTEKKLIEFIKKTRPDDAILSEECGEIPANNNSPYKWVLDPIDGTNNFLHAVPFFCISLALLRKDEVIAGVIYNPITTELYYAEKGQGAFVMTPTGDVRLRVSARKDLEQTMVATNSYALKTINGLVDRMIGKPFSFRCIGSTALALAGVAAGQLDVFFDCRSHIWDLAAGYLLVKEAGGIVQTLDGKTDIPSILNGESVLATSLNLREKVLNFIKPKEKTCKKKKTSV